MKSATSLTGPMMPTRRRLSIIRLVILLASIFALLGGQPTNAAASTRKQSSTSGKTVHVKEYTRKDGTTVKAHDRKPPDSTKAAKPSTSSGTASTGSAAIARDANGRIERSAAAKDSFMRETGYPHGRPGYVVDHIVPLACGGADAPSNMQWQTVADGKAKDKTERKGCGGSRR